MTPVLTVFADSPGRGRGLARDMRARWAFEETGQPYDVRLVPMAELKSAAHLARHPFGQIPTYEAGGLALFESGAIVLQIAQGGPGLLPADPDGRARAINWVFAALNTVEPPIVERETSGYLEADKPWHRERQGVLDDRIRVRLDQLSRRLGTADWLDGDFSAGDLMMVTVLRRLDGSGLVRDQPPLADYVARAEARPAYQRAFAAQRALFTAQG